MIPYNSVAWSRLTGCLLLGLAAAGCSGTAGSPSGGTVPQTSITGADTLLQLPEPYTIEITGSENRWRARYPSLKERPETDNVAIALRDLHIPQGVKIVFVLKSTDFVYTLAFPELGLKEIAVPSLEFRLEFGPLDAGQFVLEGDQLCGEPHPELQGQLVVESPERSLAWLRHEVARTLTTAPH